MSAESAGKAILICPSVGAAGGTEAVCVAFAPPLVAAGAAAEPVSEAVAAGAAGAGGAGGAGGAAGAAGAVPPVSLPAAVLVPWVVAAGAAEAPVEAVDAAFPLSVEADGVAAGAAVVALLVVDGVALAVEVVSVEVDPVLPAVVASVPVVALGAVVAGAIGTEVAEGEGGGGGVPVVDAPVELAAPAVEATLAAGDDVVAVEAVDGANAGASAGAAAADGT